MRRLETEQGDLTQFQERQAKAAAQKADLEVQLTDIKGKLEVESEKRQNISAQRRILEADLSSVKKDVVEMEERIARAEAEKTSRDHTMRQLNDEIANQDEIISKLNKVRVVHTSIGICCAFYDFLFKTSFIESHVLGLLRYRKRSSFKKITARRQRNYRMRKTRSGI